MSQYSPVAPIHLLRQLFEKNMLGNYLLMLAHDVLEQEAGYVQLVDDIIQRHGECFIIMDNGTIERGSPVSLSELLHAAGSVDANVVVSPDIQRDFEGTKKLVIEQADTIRGYFPMMFIPQGADQGEIRTCCEWFTTRYPEPAYWGIPRWFRNELVTRQFFISMITQMDPDAKIHLLGMSTDLTDDIRSAQHASVIGIDSANPLVLGHNNLSIGDGGTKHLERGDYWDCRTLNEMMEYNVEWVRSAIRIT